MRACKHLIQTLAHTSNHVSANTNACCSLSSQSVRGIARCVAHSHSHSLSLTLTLTSDVDEFLFLYHLCFSCFSSPCFFSSSSKVFVPVGIHKGSGSHDHFCSRPCSSTCRWARLSTHRHSGPHSAIRALVPTLTFAPRHLCHRQR